VLDFLAVPECAREIAVTTDLQWAADPGQRGMNIVGVIGGTAVCAYTTGSQKRERRYRNIAGWRREGSPAAYHEPVPAPCDQNMFR